MKGLVFHWDTAIAFDTSEIARKKLLKQWTHTIKAFGVYKLIVIGGGDLVPPMEDLEITMEKFTTYDEVLIAYPGHSRVVLVDTGTDVDSVVFPTGDVLFVLGSNYANPIVNEGDTTVSVSAIIPLWDVVAAGIVLHKAQ